METSTNSYKLNQGKKEYIFSTSIVGNKIRISCQNTNDINSKKHSRDFTMEQFREIDDLFNFIKTPHHASEYIDRVLRNQKVGINDENGEVIINFYIKTDGLTHRIDIPLVDQPSNDGDINKYFENIGMSSTKYYSNENLFQNNYDINNINQYLGANTNIQYNQNVESTPMNKYYNNSQRMPISQYENYFEPPVIAPANNSTNQILNSGYSNKIEMHKYSVFPSSPNINLNNRQFVLSQNVVTSPLIHSPKMKVEDNINIDDRIKKLLQEQNIIVNDDFTQAKTQEEINQIDSPRKPLTNVNNALPIQPTTKVLPSIGPYTSYVESAFGQSSDYNTQMNNNSVFQNVNLGQSGDEFINSILSTPTHNNVVTTNQKIEASINKTSKNNQNLNLNLNLQNNNINQELKNLRNENLALKKKIAELEPLKMKMAEMETLKGQLAELNMLRAQVAEYNSVKGQLKEIDYLKAQLEQMNSLKMQLSQFNILKKKAEEADKLKLKVDELEEIRIKNEEEIKNLRENLLYYSIKSQNNNDSKDVIYDEEEDTIKGNIIHDTDELEMLTRKINKDNKKLTLNLLYKATADSDRAAAFHAKCDEAQSSVVLVETDKGKRFGGYTSISWSGDCVDKKDPNAFVFSLDKMETYDNIPEEDAIGCYPKFGPIFLGCQIRIYDKAFSKGGTTFERGLNYDTKEDFELTGGERVFNVKEIEVYEVVFE
jgi:hypothetical protein